MPAHIKQIVYQAGYVSSSPARQGAWLVKFNVMSYEKSEVGGRGDVLENKWCLAKLPAVLGLKQIRCTFLATK